MLLSQPPSWWPTELVGFTVLIFSLFNHRYNTAKQLKTKKCYFCYQFSILAVATTELMWHQVEPIRQSLLCGDVIDTKRASFYPGKGTQWVGMTKMVKWILTPNLVINTYDHLLHRLSIFCLSFLPKITGKGKKKRRHQPQKTNCQQIKKTYVSCTYLKNTWHACKEQVVSWYKPAETQLLSRY